MPEVREQGLICLGLCTLLDKVCSATARLVDISDCLANHFRNLTNFAGNGHRFIRFVRTSESSDRRGTSSQNIPDCFRYPHALRHFFPGSQRSRGRLMSQSFSVLVTKFDVSISVCRCRGVLATCPQPRLARSTSYCSSRHRQTHAIRHAPGCRSEFISLALQHGATSDKHREIRS